MEFKEPQVEIIKITTDQSVVCSSVTGVVCNEDGSSSSLEFCIGAGVMDADDCSSDVV